MMRKATVRRCTEYLGFSPASLSVGEHHRIMTHNDNLLIFNLTETRIYDPQQAF